MAPTTRSVSCSVCHSKIDKYDDKINCVKCLETFHLVCVNVSLQEFQNRNEQDSLKSWSCSRCSTITSIYNDSEVNNVSDKDENKGIDKILEEFHVLCDKVNLLTENISKPCRCCKVVNALVEQNTRLQGNIVTQADEIKELRKLIETMFDKMKIVSVSSDDVGTVRNDIAELRQIINDERNLAHRAINVPVPVRVNQDNDKNPLKIINKQIVGLEGATTSRTGRKQLMNTGQKGDPTVEKIADCAAGGVPGDKSEDLNQRSGAEVLDNDGWQQVKVRKAGRNRAPAISGTRKLTSNKLKVVARKAFLHVTRLDPATKCEDLVDFIKDIFPEVECEQLQSKHPNSYASFRVAIAVSNIDSALKPDVWPTGVLVSRFFQRRRQGTEEKRRP